MSYGRPEVLPSWLFRALIWPFWSWREVEGLFAWRWLTTLVVFGFLWASARRMGARGFVPLVVLAWCALVYRSRSQVRPETLAAVLIAIQIWILESRRHGHKTPLLALVPVTWLWVNAHVSWFIAFVLLGIHAIATSLARDRRARGRSARVATAPRLATAPPKLSPYLIAAGLMAVVAFLQPFGLEGLWQPFDYALNLSREPLFQGIGELQPVSVRANWRSGAIVMIVLWPALIFWRGVRQRRVDGVEIATCLLATAYAVPSQRFLGVYAILAAPYLARDLEEWGEARRWPAWTRPAAARATLAALACGAIGIAEWRRPALEPGIGVAMERFPVAASDFMARHGVRGRGFQHFRFVGYQAWRFWPDRDRLPFMDIHQSGTPEDRAAFVAAFASPGSFGAIADRYRLDYVLMDRRQASGAPLLEVLDADSVWKLVFVDDVAGLYVRRRGALAAVADSFGFVYLGAGTARTEAVASRAAQDSVIRSEVEAELERAARQSRWNATLRALLGNLALAAGDPERARGHLEAALAVDSRLAGVHQRLGIAALWKRRFPEAIAHLEQERRLSGTLPGIELAIGMAHEQSGDTTAARRHYLRELEVDPSSVAARERLSALGGNSR